MFGFAPLMEIATERLYVPMKPKDWDGHPGSKSRPLFPTYGNGEKRFFDPFPALLIQDEAHLLDESLGTFSVLFESALEAAFDELAPLIKGNYHRDIVSVWWHDGTSNGDSSWPQVRKLSLRRKSRLAFRSFLFFAMRMRV